MKKKSFRVSKKNLLLGFGVLLLCLFIFLFTQTPILINATGLILNLKSGIGVKAKAFSLKPGLRGDLVGLSVGEGKTDSINARVERVDFDAYISKRLRPAIEKIILYSPDITLKTMVNTHRDTVNQTQKPLDETDSSNPQTLPEKQKLPSVIQDCLNKLPTIKKMVVKKGKMAIHLSENQTLSLTDIQIEVNNINTSERGKIFFKSGFSLLPASTKTSSKPGNISLSLDLIRLSPYLSGKGYISINLPEYREGGASLKGFHLETTIVLDKWQIILPDMTTALDSLSLKEKQIPRLNQITCQGILIYDLEKENIAIKGLKATFPEIGSIEGAIGLELQEVVSWHCSLSSDDFRLTPIPEIISPFLEESQRGWSLAGKGGLTTKLHGNLLKGKMTMGGELELSWKGIGFNSPDSTKAGEGIDGSIHLEIAYPQPRLDRASFLINGKIEGGEYLWGSLYRDLKGKSVSWDSEGFFLHPLYLVKG